MEKNKKGRKRVRLVLTIKQVCCSLEPPMFMGPKIWLRMNYLHKFPYFMIEYVYFLRVRIKCSIRNGFLLDIKRISVRYKKFFAQ